jgi:hypothetical protein
MGDRELSEPASSLVIELADGTWWQLPETLHVPPGTEYFLGEDDGHCRAITQAKGRCQGVRQRATGLCGGHSGNSRILDDPAGMQKKGAAGKARLRERRSLLVSNGINPRKAAREAAIQRSERIVRALVDEPLDDPELSTMQRQKAVLGMLDAVFPLAQVTAEIELPADADAIEGMGWQDMQRLALQLAGQEQDT